MRSSKVSGTSSGMNIRTTGVSLKPGSSARSSRGLAVAEAVVAGRLLGLLLHLAHLGEPLAGAPAVVGLALGEQPLDVGPVGVEPLALAVGRERATEVGPLVPRQPQPVQRVVDLLLAVRTEPGAVGVLDAQEEAPALLPREREVEQRHVGRADVRVPRGRRGDAESGAAGCGGGLFAHGAPSLGTPRRPSPRAARRTGLRWRGPGGRRPARPRRHPWPTTSTRSRSSSAAHRTVSRRPWATPSPRRARPCATSTGSR